MKKQKDGYYHAIVQRNGIRKSIRAKTVKELNNKKAEYIANVENNTISKYMLFSKYSEKWLSHIEKTKAYRTHEMYASAVKILNDRIGHISIKDLTSTHLQEIIDEYSDRPRSAQMISLTAKRIIKNAVIDRIITYNICEGLIVPKYEPKEKEPFNEIEKYAIEHADLTSEQRLYVDLLYYTGMRREEALALTRANLKDDRIEIRQAVSFQPNKPVIKVAKTQASRRSVPYPEALKKSVNNHDFTIYLINRNGEPMSRSSFNKFWRNIKKKLDAAAKEKNPFADVSKITSHRFRHNFASVLYENNVPVKVAQKILGHKSITVTLDIYTHLAKNSTTNLDIDSFFSKVM